MVDDLCLNEYLFLMDVNEFIKGRGEKERGVGCLVYCTHMILILCGESQENLRELVKGFRHGV